MVVNQRCALAIRSAEAHNYVFLDLKITRGNNKAKELTRARLKSIQLRF